MSAKPTNVATWDSSLTHLVAPTAGHITSGYANNEIPGSGELNGQFNLIGQWSQYLNDQDFAGNMTVEGDLTVVGKIVSHKHDLRTKPLSPWGGSTYNGTISGISGSSGPAFTNTGGWYVPLNLDVGERIVNIRAGILDNVTGTTQVAFAFYKIAMATGVQTPIGSSNLSLGNGTHQTIVLNATNTTIAAGFAYQVNFSSSAANIWQVCGVEIDYDNVS